MNLSLRLLLLAALCATSASYAGTRVLIPQTGFIVLGGPGSRSKSYKLDAQPGETLAITIAEGADDSGDRGMTWWVEDYKGLVLGKGFANKTTPMTWNVKVGNRGAVLFLEDRDTTVGNRPGAGNGIKLLVTASTTAPAPAPPPPTKGKYDNYFGGPKAWYDSGYQLGKADKKAGKSSNVERHKEHYDNITVGEFKRGYLDGYKR